MRPVIRERERKIYTTTRSEKSAQQKKNEKNNEINNSAIYFWLYFCAKVYRVYVYVSGFEWHTEMPYAYGGKSHSLYTYVKIQGRETVRFSIAVCLDDLLLFFQQPTKNCGNRKNKQKRAREKNSSKTFANRSFSAFVYVSQACMCEYFLYCSRMPFYTLFVVVVFVAIAVVVVFHLDLLFSLSLTLISFRSLHCIRLILLQV